MFLRANQQNMPIQKPEMRNPLSVYVCIVISLLLLTGCTRQNGGAGAPTSALQVLASIEPEPIVGQAVTWHIEMFSKGPEFQDTRLKLDIHGQVEGVVTHTGGPNA